MPSRHAPQLTTNRCLIDLTITIFVNPITGWIVQPLRRHRPVLQLQLRNVLPLAWGPYSALHWSSAKGFIGAAITVLIEPITLIVRSVRVTDRATVPNASSTTFLGTRLATDTRATLHSNTDEIFVRSSIAIAVEAVTYPVIGLGIPGRAWIDDLARLASLDAGRRT